MAYLSAQKPPAFPLPTAGLATAQNMKPRMAQRGEAGEASTECREAHGVRGACSRFGARWVARKRQQAGRTPCASRGSPAKQRSRSEFLLKGQWLFDLPFAPGFLF